jgi:hypothetical protein
MFAENSAFVLAISSCLKILRSILVSHKLVLGMLRLNPNKLQHLFNNNSLRVMYLFFLFVFSDYLELMQLLHCWFMFTVYFSLA